MVPLSSAPALEIEEFLEPVGPAVYAEEVKVDVKANRRAEDSTRATFRLRLGHDIVRRAIFARDTITVHEKLNQCEPIFLITQDRDGIADRIYASFEEHRAIPDEVLRCDSCFNLISGRFPPAEGRHRLLLGHMLEDDLQFREVLQLTSMVLIARGSRRRSAMSPSLWSCTISPWTRSHIPRRSIIAKMGKSFRILRKSTPQSLFVVPFLG